MKLRLKKKKAKVTAFLIDDSALLRGKLQQNTFYTNDLSAGFSTQTIQKRDVGRILFKNRKSYEECRKLHPDYLFPLPRREQKKSLIIIDGKIVLNSFILEFEGRIYDTMGVPARNKEEVAPLPVDDVQPMDSSWIDDLMNKMAEESGIPMELLSEPKEYVGITPEKMGFLRKPEDVKAMMQSYSARATIIPNKNFPEDSVRDDSLKEFIMESLYKQHEKG